MARSLQKFVLAGLLLVSSLCFAGQASPPGMTRLPEGVFHPLYRAATDPAAVPVRGFALDVLPVTNQDFLEFVRANSAWQRSKVKRLFADKTYLQSWASDLELGANAPANAPVTYISWFAAKAYAAWKEKRLPTIAEWEYAAGASATRSDGENDPEFKRQILQWYSTPSSAKLSEVGLDKANLWGLHNLHGLIWEWVSDFNTAMLTGDARNDPGLDRDRFCGAGAVGAKDVDNFPAFMRYGFRSSLRANYCVHNLGFRCAKDL